MEEFDGVNLIPHVEWQAPHYIFSTDSCLTGCGGWANGEFFHAEFPQWLLKKHNVFINEFEAMALIIRPKVWEQRIKDCNVLAYCDNAVTVDIVNTGRVNNIFAQMCLREICWLSAKQNAIIKVVHLSMGKTHISCSLSRWHLGQKYEKQFKEDTKFWKEKMKVVEDMFRFEHIW